MMSPDDNIKNSTKTRDDDTKYMKEAARWIHAKPQSNQSPTSSTSRLSSLTTKLKSLVLSKSKQDSTENIGPTFHHFSLLPNELQVQIWTYAAQAPLIHKTNYGIISSHRLTPSSTSTSTTAPPDSDSIANPPPTKPTFQVPPPQTFSSKTLSPFFSLSDPIPSSNPSNKIFFPIVPLLHTCSLSRHIFQKEWEPRLPEHLRGIIGRTGRWVVLMTKVLERQGQGILVLEEGVGWEGVSIWMGGRLDRREGRVITYYLFNFQEGGILLG